MSSPTPRVESSKRELCPLPEGQETNPYRSVISGRDTRANRPIGDEDDSEDAMACVIRRSRSPFSNINYFQSGSREQALRQIRNTSTKQGHKRRSRRPSTLSSSSGHFSYLQTKSRSSIQPTYARKPPSTFNRDSNSIQEAQDRELAQRLQKDEDSAYETLSPLSLDHIRHTARQYPWQKALRPQTSPVSSLKRVRPHSGTRENPIEVDADSDSNLPDARVVKSSVRTKHYGAIYGKPIELDESSSGSDLGDEIPVAGVVDSEKQDLNFSILLQAKEDCDGRTSRGSRECAVCGEAFLIIESPSLPGCTHPPETCASCYEEWITTQLQGSGWMEVKCPGSDCRINLTYYEIQEHARPTTFQQYDTFIARAAFNDDPNFRWCRSCDFGQIHLSGVEGNIFTCAACGHKALNAGMSFAGFAFATTIWSDVLATQPIPQTASITLGGYIDDVDGRAS
ncbi:Nn.00g034870.m01.CDS01 [Neocucurbitaria sp. VM-36]